MKTVLHNVHLIDGTGKQQLNVDILIEHGKIIEISTDSLQGELDIDGTGKTLIPGLIDCHVHLGFGGFDDNRSDAQIGALCLSELQSCFTHGITTVRNMSTKNNIDIQVRDMVTECNIKSPRLLASGKGISITGGHGWKFNVACDTPIEALKATRGQILLKADVIKLFATGGMGTKGSIPNCPQLTEEQMRVVCEEAEKVGVLTAAHCTGIEGAQNAIRAGVRSIEHIQLDEETAILMKEKQAFYCPTIITRYNIIHTTDPAFQWLRQKAKPGDLERKAQAIQLCKKYGIPICASTDSAGTGITKIGSSLSDEIALYVRYGLTHMEAIQTATQIASQMLRIENETGTIEKGKSADMVLLEENPLDDINALKKVAITFRAGEVVYKK